MLIFPDVFVRTLRRRLACLASSCALTLALSGCSSSAPEDVVKDFYETIASHRVEDAIEYLSLKDVGENDMMEAKRELQMQGSAIQKNGGLDSLTSVLIDRDDNTAHVRMEIKYKSGGIDNSAHTLVNESGEWKIRLHRLSPAQSNPGTS